MGDDPYTDLCTNETFDTWQKLSAYFDERCPQWAHWVFRGDKFADGLKSSFEKEAMERAQIARSELPDAELGLIRRFRRQAHHFVSPLPDPDDRVEWLALMQHHGAPTRLLDWSYSFYVALFFAVESAKPGDKAVIWAFDARWLGDVSLPLLSPATRTLLDSDPNFTRAETKHSLFWPKEPTRFVRAVNSTSLNQRQAIQQGVFIAPGDIRESFLTNLQAAVAGQASKHTHLFRLAIECSTALVRDAMLHLQRINVNSSTLFPGLDGFSRNLKALLLDRDRFLAVDPWDRST